MKSFKNFKKNWSANQQGFSMAEIVIVIAVLGIITAIAVGKFSSLKERQSVETAVADIVTVFNKEKSNTLASVDSLEYGVYFQSDRIVSFKGKLYNGLGYEQTRIALPSTITNVTLSSVSSIPAELYFSRLTGAPSKKGTITVTAGTFSKTITVGATGEISTN